jgi:20S proteasome alpha/beta subunit
MCARRFGPYFVSPVIAGLDEKSGAPYLCGMDTIGAIETAHDFMVAGTAPDSLYGMCESMWRPDMVRNRHCMLQEHPGCHGVLPGLTCMHAMHARQILAGV